MIIIVDTKETCLDGFQVETKINTHVNIYEYPVGKVPKFLSKKVSRLDDVKVTVTKDGITTVIDTKERYAVETEDEEVCVTVETVEQIRDLLVKTKLYLCAVGQELHLTPNDNGIW